MKRETQPAPLGTLSTPTKAPDTGEDIAWLSSLRGLQMTPAPAAIDFNYMEDQARTIQRRPANSREIIGNDHLKSLTFGVALLFNAGSLNQELSWMYRDVRKTTTMNCLPSALEQGHILS